VKGRARENPGRRERSGRPRGLPAARRIGVAIAVALIADAVFLFAYKNVLAEHYARRAKDAIALRRYDAARLAALRSLALNPDQGYAAYFLGIAEAEKGRNEKAAKAFRRAAATMAHRAALLRRLGRCEEKAGRTEQAAEHLAEALAAAPLEPAGGAEPRARLGRLLFAQGRWAEGLACFRSIPETAPGALFGFDGLAFGYEHLGAPDMAVASALALLGSEKLAPRGCDHLVRLARDPQERALIASALRAVAGRLAPGDPKRAEIERALEKISPGR